MIQSKSLYEYNLNPFANIHWRASLVPAATVIPAPITSSYRAVDSTSAADLWRDLLPMGLKGAGLSMVALPLTALPLVASLPLAALPLAVALPLVALPIAALLPLAALPLAALPLVALSLASWIGCLS
jgi:hypothetical protein